ncbi:hypothetical protein B0A66_02055 [Flavobacterium hercynium]|uniref:DUF3805 domain-containing protein n=2 Tax=Flavobacterium hercynium TaxID=387094 RepID=A0A226HQ61_9FLAO|nr:hypothetical protein B0A66_02055 [Flavobacterium hercynium]
MLAKENKKKRIMLSKILFKNIVIFDLPEFSFTIKFPESLWIYRRVSKNQFWFVNKKNNQALILEYFNDKIYNEEIIKDELNYIFSSTKIGHFNSFLKCIKFVEDSISQYEWIIIDSDKKFLFSYSILDKKSEEEKDKEYEEAFSILNTLKIK